MALNDLRKSRVPSLTSILLILVLGLFVLSPSAANAYDDKLPAMNIQIEVDGDPDLPGESHSGSGMSPNPGVNDILLLTLDLSLLLGGILR